MLSAPPQIKFSTASCAVIQTSPNNTAKEGDNAISLPFHDATEDDNHRDTSSDLELIIHSSMNEGATPS